MSSKLALATALTLVFTLGVGLPAARASETWENALGQADYLFGLGRYEEARSAYRGLLDQFPGTLAVDRAVVGIAKTHLAEGDYRTGVTFLEDVLVKSSDLATKAEARTLYCNLERTIRTAESRAVAAVAEAQTAYDDLSWWNIFKIFTKLRLRSDLKAAEKDQARISELHDLFNPNLLLPDAFADDTTGSTDATGGTTATVATGGTDSTGGTAATTTATEMDRVRAYEILEDDIAALIALIPAEPTDTTTTASVDESDETTEANEDESEDSEDETTDAADAAEDTTSVVGSELTSDTSEETTPVVTSIAIAEETTEATEVIGSGDDLTSTEPSAPTTASTATVEPTTSAAATVETTPVTVTEQPAAPMSVAELRQAYIGAYNTYLQAHQGGDSAAIQSALAAYRRALQAFTDAQNNIMRNNGPSAPSSTTDSPTSPGTTSPRSSVTTVIPTGRAVIGGGVLPTDRGGRVQFGDRNNGVRSSRTGLQGN